MATVLNSFPKLINLWSNPIRCLHLSTLLSQLRVLKRPVCTAGDYNPLLNQDGLPPFRQIKPQHVVPAIEQLTKDFEQHFTEFETGLTSFEVGCDPQDELSWSSVIEPLEKLSYRLAFAWGVVSHLNGVRNDQELRTAYEKVQPLVVKASIRTSQSLPLYNTLKEIERKQSWLDEGQKRVISSFLRSARNGGVALDRKDKERFNAIQMRLAELGNRFSNNILDAVKSFSIILTDPENVSGLPESLLKMTAEAASLHIPQNEQNSNTSTGNLSDTQIKPDHQKGPWKLTLDLPCFEPFMKYSQNRGLREQMYRAFITRASHGITDNSEIIEEIRALSTHTRTFVSYNLGLVDFILDVPDRQEKAALLEFKSYALLSLDSKMADSPSEVWRLITELQQKSKPAAEIEIRKLQSFAEEYGFTGELQQWDVPYWAQKQRQFLFSFTDEDLRPYFPLPRVLEGLFKLSSELFGITIQPADAQADVWHPDVRFFHIHDENGNHVASFFLDPYSRPAEKRGGAWMDQCLDKSEVLGNRPVAYLVCNQAPPGADGTPSLMTFRDVETLFHEFGHGLQHMLTTVPYTDAAGIKNIEWDAVELPSQFMENWLYDITTMNLVSGHYQTGESLPDDLFLQVSKARRFMAGSQMLRQLYFSALDMELYTSSEPWRVVQSRISDDYTVLKPLDEDRFPCSFLHIFSSGYAAGYYSYKWAEVMSADCFSAFEDVGLTNRSGLRQVGRRFRDTVLASGGARHPRDVFQAFRGRPPSSAALLKSYGLQ